MAPTKHRYQVALEQCQERIGELMAETARLQVEVEQAGVLMERMRLGLVSSERIIAMLRDQKLIMAEVILKLQNQIKRMNGIPEAGY